jgi:putative two-component system response regulator
MNKLNVLIVDDDTINRKLIKALLAHHKDIIENITEASNGAEALEHINKDSSINLVLLDIIMPILDGKGFLKQFRSQKANSNTPVIVLTTDDSKISEVVNYGADDVLIKPIKEDDLLKKIEYWTQEAE